MATNGQNINLSIGSRAALLFLAYHEGEGAFLHGHAETACPYIDPRQPRQHAAWRTGWSDMQIRMHALDIAEVKNPLTELHLLVGRYWTSLCFPDQQRLLDWMATRRKIPRVQ